MTDTRFRRQVDELAARLRARGLQLAMAESCTGGWLAKACTDRAGSSDWFEGSLVTYSDLAKTRWLGVSPALIADYGAVSAEVVAAMASGTLRNSAAHWAVAISGVAGPGGGSQEKPVGTVYCGWAGPGREPESECFHFPGDREAVRSAAVAAALDGLLARIG